VNVTTQDIIEMKHSPEERKRMILVKMQQENRPMMLCDFKDSAVVYNRIRKDLDQLHDEGLVSRHINGGKLEFRVNK